MSESHNIIMLANRLAPSPRWASAALQIKAEHDHAINMVRSNNTAVYGSNTLTGHLDDNKLNPNQAWITHENILREHAIGGSTFMSRSQARLVGFARMHTWSNGGSGISPYLFELAEKGVTNRHFSPAVPLDSSYSCGDVIPAAHWSLDLLDTIRKDHQVELSPPDLMGLINGAFISIGFSLSLLPRIENCYQQILMASRLMGSISGFDFSSIGAIRKQQDTGDLWQSMEPLIKPYQPIIKPNQSQHPVSFRALPQALSSFARCHRELQCELDLLLSQPSCNPYFDLSRDEAVSQASFLTPSLTLKLGSCIESALMMGWLLVNRCNHLLSGKVPSIPRDMRVSDASIGMIQYPKLMMAKLEEARLISGRRTFASGGDTSYGVEDLWTNSLNSARQLDSMLDALTWISAIELRILIKIIDNLEHANPLRQYLPEALKCDPDVHEIQSYFECSDHAGVKP
ncbi:aromatic amino acid lyase [Wenzhouxiangella sp. AB-CW3]|uniref:aromatic amino acid lyase n=1 Tax=Wenzhouxiangella sp. AB-CW3 TaxID=2771012 RepID=UPI00168AAD01|nr:aromatic amino acid lyase [Wenzhouxiangella sp. AB-CW3]QOC23655.1 aromatic amino acid lyase [Wenzhouxiangella sp. AB-CW3]